MDTSIGWLLLLQVVLIALNAVFACAEIAVLSVNEVKLSKMVSEGNRKARRLSRLTAQPARFLATIQVAITLAGFLGSAFAAENFSDPLVDWLVGLGVTIPPATLNTLAVILITLILSFFTLVFGAAIAAGAQRQRFGARHMHAAVRAGHGVLRRRQGRLARRLFVHAALSAQPGIDQHQHHQNDQVLHRLRPSSTSSTKREPT